MSRMIRFAFLFALALPLAAQQVDSPLVALAKRTGRLGKVPTHVITNEDVAAARGRVSWAGYDSEPAQTQETSDNTSAAKPAPVNRPAGNDWAQLEQERAKRLEREARSKQQPPPPQIDGSSRATYTPMQSSASNATVSSSASNATPYSTAQPTQVRSTAISTTADQTASASNPQPVQPRNPN